MGLVSDKNYIVANAVENILAGKSPVFNLLSPQAPHQQGQRLFEEKELWKDSQIHGENQTGN